MNIKEKLVELIDQARVVRMEYGVCISGTRHIAEHLIANGVTFAEDNGAAERRMIMTLKEFAKMLDGRVYGHEITLDEETLAKELGFVVVFGYSDDNAELRGAIDDEIGCFDGGVLEHKDLPSGIYADWCPEDMDCSWAYDTSIPHEKFHIYDDGELYCVGIVCDIKKPKQTNADRIRAMSDEELTDAWIRDNTICHRCAYRNECELDEFVTDEKCREGILEWLKQPAEGKDVLSNMRALPRFAQGAARYGSAEIGRA